MPNIGHQIEENVASKNKDIDIVGGCDDSISPTLPIYLR